MFSLVNFFLVLSLLSQICHLVSTRSVVYDVRDYGAIGDGDTDDTNGLRKAWEATCKSSSYLVTMVIPSNTTLLTHPLHFEGPCNPHYITVEIDGIIRAPQNPSEWKCREYDCDGWMYFSHLDGLSITGLGTLHGRGDKWWDMNAKEKPAALKIENCKNVGISGLFFKDNPRVHIVLNSIESLKVSDIKIQAPSDSPNTDGMHIERCTDVTINHSTFATGDDCISIGTGSSNIRISHVVCGPGHGISIGSLGRDGATDKVENILVSDVVFMGTSNGARIKTWQGGRGYAKNITYERILCQEVANPIIIDQFYCDIHRKCNVHNFAVKIKDVTFKEILGTSKDEMAIKLECSATMPCEGVVMDNIYLLSGHGEHSSSSSNNAYGSVNGQIVPHISLN